MRNNPKTTTTTYSNIVTLNKDKNTRPPKTHPTKTYTNTNQNDFEIQDYITLSENIKFINSQINIKHMFNTINKIANLISKAPTTEAKQLIFIQELLNLTNETD